MNSLKEGLEATIEGKPLDQMTFSEPWMARAFAVTLASVKTTLFTLNDFQSVLIERIKESEARGEPIVDEDGYYTCWLDALTRLLEKKATLTEQELDAAEAKVCERLVSLQHVHNHHTHALGSDSIKPVFIENSV